MKCEIIQYFVVNKELDMSFPKLLAQITKLVTEVTLRYQNDENFKEWLNTSRTTVLLSGKRKDLEKLISSGFQGVVDEGRTEVPPNSLTVVALPPMPKERAKQYVKRLQVYKVKSEGS